MATLQHRPCRVISGNGGKEMAETGSRLRTFRVIRLPERMVSAMRKAVEEISYPFVLIRPGGADFSHRSAHAGRRVIAASDPLAAAVICSRQTPPRPRGRPTRPPGIAPTRAAARFAAWLQTGVAGRYPHGPLRSSASNATTHAWSGSNSLPDRFGSPRRLARASPRAARYFLTFPNLRTIGAALAVPVAAVQVNRP